MPTINPAILWNTAEEIRACVCDTLTNEGTCGCPCRTCVIVGTPVFDDCCQGQLTVSLQRLWVHGNFPQRDSQPIFCSSPLAAEYLVTYVRCAQVVRDDGSAPTCDQLSAEALSIYTDMYVVERGLICCLAQAKRKRKFMMGDATPISPQGACTGFEIRLTIEIEDTLSDL
jgi:hypothetical protein